LSSRRRFNVDRVTRAKAFSKWKAEFEKKCFYCRSCGLTFKDGQRIEAYTSNSHTNYRHVRCPTKVLP
jgi:hypothetical protein